MNDEANADQQLASLRGEIDKVDRQLLELLAQRKGIVTKIASSKRAHRRPIRDRDREHRLLASWDEWAQELELDANLVKRLFRAIIHASREQQAALRTEVPMKERTRLVTVIGGKGAMGSLMVQLFRDVGHEVRVLDRDSAITVEAAAASADVVVVSVPILETEAIIRRVGPQLRTGALLMDVTSLKVSPMAAMLEHPNIDVVGTHPLFGPPLRSLQGQRVVVTRGRGKSAFDWVCGVYRARGIEVIETTPEHHDRAMSIVQVLTHFSLETLGLALSRLGMPLEETLSFTSPIYLAELLLVARHYSQSPDLYSAIHSLNPENESVTAEFVAAACEIRDRVRSGDPQEFRQLFHGVREYLGRFSDDALDRSARMIDHIAAG